MKRSCKDVNERRMRILELINERKKIEVSYLIDTFDVSPATLRRDLQELEDKKFISHDYGSVRINKFYNSISDSSTISNKILIAKYVAEQIKQYDTILINTSSTAIQVLKYIEGKKVTVITNNANAILMEYSPEVSVYLTGGELRTPKYSMTGDMALNNLKTIKANVCIIGVNGISMESGLTSNFLTEASINNLMIDQCNGNVYVVCNHNKLGKEAAFKSADINKITHIITDKAADKDLVKQFREAGIEVVLV